MLASLRPRTAWFLEPEPQRYKPSHGASRSSEDSAGRAQPKGTVIELENLCGRRRLQLHAASNLEILGLGAGGAHMAEVAVN